MLRNYFKIAWRNLWKHKFYSLINIAGLAAGLAVGILILIWVQGMLSFDRFHKDADHIYRVLANQGSGSSRQVWATTPAPIATFAKREIPEVKDAVRIINNWDFSLFSYKDKKFVEKQIFYVDPSFFRVFDFKLLAGDPDKPFRGTNSVIITSSIAKKYFGDEAPVGKVLLADNKESFVVTGVLEDFPENSSINYDMLFPMSLYAKNFGGNGQWKTIDEDWGNYNYTIFLQLNSGTKTEAVEAKLTQIHRNNKRGTELDPYSLQPLTDMVLYQTDGSEGLIQTVRIFLIVGVLILLIACINYANLSTARSILRSKEVSVRKIIGAAKTQLFIQFIVETAIVFVFSTLSALLLMYLLLPAFNSISGGNVQINLLDIRFWTIIGIATFATLLFSSVYPALLLSSFEPLK